LKVQDRKKKTPQTWSRGNTDSRVKERNQMLKTDRTKAFRPGIGQGTNTTRGLEDFGTEGKHEKLKLRTKPKDVIGLRGIFGERRRGSGLGVAKTLGGGRTGERAIKKTEEN